MPKGHVFNRPAQASTEQVPGSAMPAKLPALVRLVLIFTVVAFYGGGRIFGINLSGLGWALPFAMALLILARNPDRVTFPFGLWLPWFLLLFTYLSIVDYSLLDPRVIPLQRTSQVLCPVIIGMAVSTYRPTSKTLSLFANSIRKLAYILLGIVLLKLGILFTGRLPKVTGLAAEVMTVILLCTYFTTRYLLFKEKKDAWIWVALALVPVAAVTRTAIAVTLLTFPLSLAPLRKSRRLLILIFMVLVGLGAFYSPRMQNKMFFSGHGELSDIFSDNFATSGRSFIWGNMIDEAHNEMWAGHGTGTGETTTYRLTGNIAYPHNDWLLTYFDYGLLGIGVLLICIALSIANGLKKIRACRDNNARLMLLAGTSAFIPFMLMMVTDNILVYASFFGNLHFTILGLAYGACRHNTHRETH